MTKIRSAALRVCALALTALICTTTIARLLAADVVITNDGTLDSTTAGGFDVGQTFTATKTGRLTKIEVAVEGNAVVGTATLRVYEGAGTGGTELYSKTGISLRNRHDR